MRLGKYMTQECCARCREKGLPEGSGEPQAEQIELNAGEPLAGAGMDATREVNACATGEREDLSACGPVGFAAPTKRLERWEPRRGLERKS